MRFFLCPSNGCGLFFLAQGFAVAVPFGHVLARVRLDASVHVGKMAAMGDLKRTPKRDSTGRVGAALVSS